MLTIQNYVRAQSLQQAYDLNQKKSSRILGGMMWLKMQNNTVNTAIDLCDLGLGAIEETAETFSIGAMVTLRQLETHPGLNAYTRGAMARAVESIVGVQFRNMATVGGSIFGRFGFSDVMTIFLAMDTQVELFGAGKIPLEQFAEMPQDRDLLVRLIVKKRPGRFVYQSMRNTRTDLPVLTCAAAELDGAHRVVIGARPARAMVLRDEEGLLRESIDLSSAHTFAVWVAGHTPTGSNVRGSAAYRTRLARVLTERALLELGEPQQGGSENGD